MLVNVSDNGTMPPTLETCDNQGPSQKEGTALIATATEGLFLLPMNVNRFLKIGISYLSNNFSARGIMDLVHLE